MYLKELHKRGLVANSNFNFNGSAQIEGAFVVEPKPGFYEDVFVFDFKSLYPSIIMTFNIDPFTFINEVKEREGDIIALFGLQQDKPSIESQDFYHQNLMAIMPNYYYEDKEKYFQINGIKLVALKLTTSEV